MRALNENIKWFLFIQHRYFKMLVLRLNWLYGLILKPVVPAIIMPPPANGLLSKEPQEIEVQI